MISVFRVGYYDDKPSRLSLVSSGKWIVQLPAYIIAHIGPSLGFLVFDPCLSDILKNYVFICRLFNAYKTCNELTLLAIQYLLKERSPYSPISSRLAFNTIEKYEILEGPSDLVLASTLARDLKSLQILAIKNNHTLQVQLYSYYTSLVQRIRSVHFVLKIKTTHIWFNLSVRLIFILQRTVKTIKKTFSRSK